MSARVRIIAALLVGSAVIGTALWLNLTKQTKTPLTTQNGTVVVATPVRENLPSTDSNDDGVPDWADILIGDTIELDTDTNNTTVTGTIANDIYDALIATEEAGRVLNVDEFIAEQVEQAEEQMRDQEFTRHDVVLGTDDSLAAQHAYGVRVAEIMLNANASADLPDELTLLSRALRTQDELTLGKLDTVISDYDNMLQAMLTVRVPPSLVIEHVQFLNVYQALRNDIRAFRNVFEDPVLALVRLERYYYDAAALYTAITSLYQKLHDAGIQWNEGDAPLGIIVVES